MSTSSSISRSGSISRAESISGPRTWIFRVLTLVGAGMFLASWFLPWWQAWIVYLKTTAIYVYAWGVESFLPPEYASSISGYEMPGIFTPFMRAYLLACMVALVCSMFASSATRFRLGKLNLPLPTALVLGVGISYVVCVIVALIVMSMRVGEFFHAPLIGTIYIGLDEGHKSNVDMMLLPGYFLACATGPALIILALLRKRIVGR